MRRITEEHLADLCEADYRNLMGVTREEFGRMLQALEEGYRRTLIVGSISVSRALPRSPWSTN